MAYSLAILVPNLLSDQYPSRALLWRLRTSNLFLTSRPLLMGIVNVTPDSFSDGGKYQDEQAAVEHALQLVEDGADILDVGGESTRPYSEPVDLLEELSRVIGVVSRLSELTDVPISIDTSKAAVAREAIAAGAQIFNDVTGLTSDPESVRVAVDSGVGVCAMHMQGTPQTMQDDPQYHDVVVDITEYLTHVRDRLIEYGVLPERICLDPGIGFGKTHQHNLTLVASTGISTRPVVPFWWDIRTRGSSRRFWVTSWWTGRRQR